MKFRPHHFLCTLGFEGKGYSSGFVKNYNKISETLKDDPNTEIEVVEFLDDICGACPKRKDELHCTSQDQIALLDARHKDALGIKIGDHLTWAQAKALIRSNITLKKFHHICDGCEWKELGVCESALLKLQNQ